ncbi:hypothetical protein E4T56_gene571 [Termitomyces sp. T112]|nr:hypothetical protein E4T56_gene571 [Termitomyces sp. T112]
MRGQIDSAMVGTLLRNGEDSSYRAYSKVQEEEVEAWEEDHLFLVVDHCHPWEEVHQIQEDQMRALLVRKMVWDMEL